MNSADIQLWGQTVGAVSLDANSSRAFFQFEPDFLESGLDVAPVMMPLNENIFSFPDLIRTSFKGLPWTWSPTPSPTNSETKSSTNGLHNSGRQPGSFTAIERLCYTGTRGMGALEFFPAVGPNPTQGQNVEVSQLVALANEIVSERDHFDTQLTSRRT